jgi:hypothetical protein
MSCKELHLEEPKSKEAPCQVACTKRNSYSRGVLGNSGAWRQIEHKERIKFSGGDRDESDQDHGRTMGLFDNP